jgi:polyphenol oxidase
MEIFPSSWILPDWPAPANIKAVITTRAGGRSLGPYAEFNLAYHVGDDAAHVQANRQFLRNLLPSEPKWLNQIHGNAVVRADDVDTPVAADAAFTPSSNVVCVVMTADCLPILLCDRRGVCVAAIHAGWRSLKGGVIENTVMQLPALPSEILAYLGPGIGPNVYLVDDDVRDAFLTVDESTRSAFTSHPCGKWTADLYALARQKLLRVGINNITGGHLCTFSDQRFFSHRRDRITGRQATMIWRCDGSTDE